MSKNKEKFGIVLPIILLSYFMILLDNSVIFTSTVKIAQELHLNAQTLAWVSSAYTLTFGGFQLFGGRIGDVFGRKRVFLIGLVLFSFGSLMVGLSTNAAMIISMRAFQGIGSAILAPTTLALLLDSYQGTMRTRAIAAYGATAGLGASFGLILGGIITSVFSWRYGFFLNVPVGILMFVLTIFFVHDSKTEGSRHLDFVGTLLSVIGLSALVYSIDGTSHQILALIVAIVALILFVYAEKRIKNPIMPLKLFMDRERSSAYIARFFFIGAAFAYFFVTPQALQRVYGFTPLMAGLAFLPATLPQFFSATQVSRVSMKIGNDRLILVSIISGIIGVLLSAVLGLSHGYWLAVGIPMIFFGVGQGLGLSPLTIAGVANTDADIAGAASGVVNTVHQFGQSVGMSIVVAMTSGFNNPATSDHYQLLIIAVIFMLSFIASLGIQTKKQ
ncbi:MFS transporter [Lactiplantibacillus pentosus]|uniref:MFS transporter n=1 Tax=Lactiplantibacillus pentosus TaxID=1589 RepID=UPI001FD63F0C|nr:MFS transporter [Lactiplantibacillus pentosus]MCJ8185210.1 MFS transporter [Lactiplantibacillus pentosus]